MSASILTMWPAHFILLLTNLPVWTVLLHHIFRQVVHLSFVNPLCSCYSTKTRTNFQVLLLFCQRHCLQIQALRTFLFSFFKMFLSNMTPSTFPQAFAPCCIRHRISTSECSSSLTIPPNYTKPSTWLNSLSSKLMFKCSLWCQTHISPVFSRLIIGPCFLNIPSIAPTLPVVLVFCLLSWPDRLHTSPS